MNHFEVTVSPRVRNAACFSKQYAALYQRFLDFKKKIKLTRIDENNFWFLDHSSFEPLNDYDDFCYKYDLAVKNYLGDQEVTLRTQLDVFPLKHVFDTFEELKVAMTKILKMFYTRNSFPETTYKKLIAAYLVLYDMADPVLWNSALIFDHDLESTLILAHLRNSLKKKNEPPYYVVDQCVSPTDWQCDRNTSYKSVRHCLMDFILETGEDISQFTEYNGTRIPSRRTILSHWFQQPLNLPRWVEMISPIFNRHIETSLVKHLLYDHEALFKVMWDRFMIEQRDANKIDKVNYIHYNILDRDYWPVGLQMLESGFVTFIEDDDCRKIIEIVLYRGSEQFRSILTGKSPKIFQ